MSPLAFSLRFLQTQSDAQLAALARAGHERAFEALVRRYRRQLLAYCRRVGSVGSNAEDTLQQALLQAWSAIRTGVEVRDPRAWLFRIVHNVAVSNQRRPVLIPVELRDTAGVNGADAEAEQRMAARDALAGLAALPDLQREVMVGTAVDGMSHEELASALGLSSGAVRGLIYRARAALRAAAAAITPGPVISWALRAGPGPSAGAYEALAGGGSAGIGGLLVKSGVIAATAGAIATASGISTDHKAPPRHPAAPTAAAGRARIAARPPTASANSNRVFVIDPTSSATHHASSAGDVTVGRAGREHGSGHTSDHGLTGFSGRRRSAKRHDGSGSRSGFGGTDHGGTSGTGGRRPGSHGSDGGSEFGSGSGKSGSGFGTGSHSGSGSTTMGGGSGSDDHVGTISGTDGGGSRDGGTTGGGGTTGDGRTSGDGGTSDGATSGGGGTSDGGSSGSGSLLPSGDSPVATISSSDGGGSDRNGGTTTTTSTTASTALTSPILGTDGSSYGGRDGGK